MGTQRTVQNIGHGSDTETQRREERRQHDTERLVVQEQEQGTYNLIAGKLEKEREEQQAEQGQVIRLRENEEAENPILRREEENRKRLEEKGAIFSTAPPKQEDSEVDRLNETVRVLGES